MPLDSGPLDRVRDLYDRTLFLQAYEQARRLGPFESWESPAALVLASRLAARLGADARGSRLIRKAARQAPEDPEVRYYHAISGRAAAGPFRLWTFLASQPPLRSDATPDVLSSWYALHAATLAGLRDFARAEVWMARALEVAPRSEWCRVEQARLLAGRDRREEALEIVEDVLRGRPHHRPALLTLARLLASLDRVDAAVARLEGAAREVECAGVVSRLSLLLFEQGRWAESARAIDRARELSPLLDADGRRRLHAMRADVHYHLGDLAGAARHGRLAGGFFKKVAERLGRPGEPRARVLEVPFFKQDHSTCAPATLASLCAWWKVPVSPRQVAEEICYAGTPTHAQQTWAERQGFAVRQFRVTWESAVALIDRGVPFDVSTDEVISSHAQALIGYDARRRTLTFNDPERRERVEVDAEGFFQEQRSHGPRGMLLVPRSELARLDGLELPDAAHYERLHRVEAALAAQDRGAALTARDELVREAPEHPLALQARLELAWYDADAQEQLACIDRLLALFPGDPRLLLKRVGPCRDVARPGLLPFLRRVAHAPGAHPALWIEYADELRRDAREERTAARFLQRAIRSMPSSGYALHVLGDLLWRPREVRPALEPLRLGACLKWTDEHYARAYFDACLEAGCPDDGLRLLEDRVRDLGALSSEPCQSLATALCRVHRSHEALERLEQALALHPDDAALKLCVAERLAGSGEASRAAAVLEAARAGSKEVAWLRSAGMIARIGQRWSEVRAHFGRVLEREPEALDAHREIAGALENLEGPEAALRFLRERVGAQPGNAPLRGLLVEWLRGGDLREAEAAIGGLLALDPENAWARRERVINLRLQRRFDEALAELARAEALEPGLAFSPLERGLVFLQQGHLARAREELREAIRRSAAGTRAVHELLDATDTREEAREELRFVHGELVRQREAGEGLDEYVDWARRVLEPAEVLAQLRALHATAPEQWRSWSLLAEGLATGGRGEEAWTLIEEACRRFPLMPRIWLERGKVARERKDEESERTSIERALALSPAWDKAIWDLADFHQRRGELARAREILEAAVAREPSNAAHHGWLADVLAELGEHAAALERLERAVELDPSYGWAWDRSLELARKSEGLPAVVQVARRVLERHPQTPEAWRALARGLEGTGPADERIAAWRRLVDLSPRDLKAHDGLALALAEAGRSEEALAACRPALFGDAAPISLRGRACWIRAKAGEVRRALADMARVLEEDPSYYWGWARLSDWAEALGEHERMLSAGRKMVELQPENCVSHGYLAQAQLSVGQRGPAKESFRAAVQLSPDYAWAANWAFDLALEDGEIERAEEMLALLRKHAPDAFTLSREAQLLAQTRRPTEALSRFRELALTKHEERWPLEASLDALTRVGMGDTALEFLGQTVFDGRAGAAAVEVWANSAAQHGARRAAELLVGSSAPTARRAACELLSHWLRAGEMRAARELIRRAGGWLREEASTWCAAGSALWTMGRAREAAAWLGRWREVGVCDLVSLKPLLGALHALGRHEEAFSVAAEVLAAEGGDGDHSACLQRALRAALSRSAAGELAPEPVALEGLPAEDRFGHRLARAVLDARAGLPDVRGALETASLALAELEAPGPGHLRLYALAGARIAELRRSGWVSLWARWTATWTTLRAWWQLALASLGVPPSRPGLRGAGGGVEPQA